MTIGGWILWIFIAAVLISAGFSIGSALSEMGKNTPLVIGLFSGITISVIVLAFMLWWYGNTASGARAIKTQKSNFNQGIMREITVYDMNGGVIQHFKGKFDVEYDDDRILFDDENGLRHIIYYPTGTVIIDEIPD